MSAAFSATMTTGALVFPEVTFGKDRGVDDAQPDARGLPELRRAIAGHLKVNRNIACEPEQVFVFAGAQQADAIIIEDDYDGDFYYGRHAIQALQSIDRSGRVIYIGSFSKSLYPSLRLGYAVVPAQLVDVFAKRSAGSCARPTRSRSAARPPIAG